MDRQPIDRRFERLGRLISEDGVRILGRMHVMVCGMGGVGSWCAEALVRSGIGRVSLVDFDKVAITNVNRQMPALESTLGQPKVRVLAERLREINPRCDIVEREEQVNPDTLPGLLGTGPDFVVDAIDQLQHKCRLLATCVRDGISIVSSTGAGARLDPTQVRVADLSATAVDPLGRFARSYLRRKHGFPAVGPFGIPAVYSLEQWRQPLSPTHPEAERGKSELRDMGVSEPPRELRNVIMGTACFVTSVFGMTCASVVVRGLLARHGVER
jgi:tRNA A37 threonylcarbamoyladenosine dehydratase